MTESQRVSELVRDHVDKTVSSEPRTEDAVLHDEIGPALSAAVRLALPKREPFLTI